MWLRCFSKLTCYATLFLIFMGGLVTSTGSGLSVPDWPLSYGTFFPPMVGGVRYEHSHRMVAAAIGLLTLTLMVLILRVEKRKWVRNLSILAFGCVVLQGLLGGLTVLFFLPKPISIGHAVLAQTFFILTIVIAYSLSFEREERIKRPEGRFPKSAKLCVVVTLMIYIQLILGALMRHTGSGLAVYDFPTFAGRWIPRFDSATLQKINYWRFDQNLTVVDMGQVIIHFVHRLWALLITAALGFLNYALWRSHQANPLNRRIIRSLLALDALLIGQIILGAFTVLSRKEALMTSLHVVTGAAVLGISVLLTLQILPTAFIELCTTNNKNLQKTKRNIDHHSVIGSTKVNKECTNPK